MLQPHQHLLGTGAAAAAAAGGGFAPGAGGGALWLVLGVPDIWCIAVIAWINCRV